ncbi:unnamed protein product [Cladocopium goreaui]|uniref:Uncharacterized protein n=1 Tax=Cladocopium goreaui TaxID=2562237 RepID=A0A9P1FZJ6_9DINO|nr:unnamed protein product [Cladocopium goreaui]
MSAQSIAETQPDDTVFPCIKCGLDCSAKDSAVLRGANWQCKSCTNVYQILYRHMGGLPESWNNMTPESQVQFFKHAGSAIKCAPKNGRWSHVRSSLVSQMTHFHTEQRRIRCNREFLPLSVWATRGFDTKRIEANGEMREDKVFGEVWTAPLSTISDDDIRGTVEKEILEKENRLKEKKKVKGKKPADSASPPADGPGSSAFAIDDDVWSIPSEDEGPMVIGEGKPQKATKTKKEDDAAVAARRAARERDQKWKQEVGKATRYINSLNSVCHSLATVSAKVEKNPELIPDKLTDGLKQAVTQMNYFKQRATQLISASDGTKSSSLLEGFDADSCCNDQLKAAQAVLKDCRAIFTEKSREAREAKAAAPKAAPAAKRSAKAKAK